HTADSDAAPRPPPPPAAAEAFAPHRAEITRQLGRMLLAVSSATQTNISERVTNVERAGRRLALALPDTSRYAERLASLLRHGVSGLARSLDQRSERTNSFASRLRALDPNATLARGYAVVQIRDGKQ